MELETIRSDIRPFFSTGCHKSLIDSTCRIMQIATGQINKSVQSLLGKISVRRRRMPIEE
jgi:hypothetical protein